MQIERITNDEIRITLSLQYLKEKNIDLHTFMSKSIISQNFFYDVLNEARKKIGFNFKNYKLLVDTFFIPNRKIYINCKTYC